MKHRKAPRLTGAQTRALLWARDKYDNGRVPPHVFNDHRSIDNLLDAGFIAWWPGYGAPMYKFTQKGLDALERALNAGRATPQKEEKP